MIDWPVATGPEQSRQDTRGQAGVVLQCCQQRPECRAESGIRLVHGEVRGDARSKGCGVPSPLPQQFRFEEAGQRLSVSP